MNKLLVRTKASLKVMVSLLTTVGKSVMATVWSESEDNKHMVFLLSICQSSIFSQLDKTSRYRIIVI